MESIPTSPISLVHVRSLPIPKNVGGIVAHDKDLIFSCTTYMSIGFMKIDGNGEFKLVHCNDVKGGPGRAFCHPFGLALSTDKSRIFVSDFWNVHVSSMTLSAPHVCTSAWDGRKDETDKSVGGFHNMVLDHEEQELYVIDFHRDCIKVFDVGTGKIARVINLIGYTISKTTCSLVVVGKQVWLSSGWHNRILVYDKKDGKHLHSIAIPGASPEPAGMIVVGEMVVVVDRAQHRLYTVNKDKMQITGRFGERGADPLQFDRPSSVKVSEDHRFLFVLDEDNHRIQILRFRHVLALALLGGLHQRAGKNGVLMRLQKRCSIFDFRALRLPLRLAGALVELKRVK